MRRKVKKGDLTRELVLKKTILFISKKGFADTSFQNIADELGLSQTAILYHFKSKENLLLETLRYIVAHNRKTVASLSSEDDQPLDMLLKHFEGNVLWGLENPREAQVVLLLYYYAAFHKKFSKLYADILTTARGRIQKVLELGQESKVFRRDIDSAEMARTLHNELLGSFINTVTVAKNSQTLAALKRNWEKLFKAMLT